MTETYVLITKRHKTQDVLTIHVVGQARLEEDEAEVEPTPHPPAVLSRSYQFKSVLWFETMVQASHTASQ